MTITFAAFKKRFGQETPLRLTNGVVYNSWKVSKSTYRQVIPNTPYGKICHYLDGNTMKVIAVKTGKDMTLFTNPDGERLALISR